MPDMPRHFSDQPPCTGMAAIIALLTVFGAAHATSPPDSPDGYVVAAADGAWVFRPAGEVDSELVIRVLGPFASEQAPDAFLMDWVASRNGRGYSTPTTRPNLSVTTRETRIGEHRYIEAVSAIRSMRGDYFIEQVAVPTDRAILRSSLTKANGEIGGAISRGEILSPPPGPDNTRQTPAMPMVRALPSERASHSTDATLQGGSVRSIAAQNVGAIDSIGFDSQTHMGAGGYMTFDPTPIVLFKSGEAVDDMTALNAPAGLAAHRAAHATAWMHWRRTGKVIEVERKGQWKKLYYTKTLGPAPAGYRLAGDYQRLSGGGNIAVGGTASVVVWKNLSFDHSGAFTSGAGSGVSTETAGDGGVRVVTTGRRPDEQGAYEITGFTLTLRYASGRVEQRAILVDPQEPDTMWLDGEGWSRGSAPTRPVR